MYCGLSPIQKHCTMYMYIAKLPLCMFFVTPNVFFSELSRLTLFSYDVQALKHRRTFTVLCAMSNRFCKSVYEIVYRTLSFSSTYHCFKL